MLGTEGSIFGAWSEGAPEGYAIGGGGEAVLVSIALVYTLLLLWYDDFDVVSAGYCIGAGLAPVP